MEEEFVNNPCELNDHRVDRERKGWTVNRPPEEHFGSNRHFFGKPDKKYIAK